MRETKELFVGGLQFSFGGGIGGEFLEEPAANLKTLREAKREDDEADCFWTEAELVGVAIVFGMRVGCTDKGQRLAGVVREGPCLSLVCDDGTLFRRSPDLGLFEGQPSRHSHGTLLESFQESVFVRPNSVVGTRSSWHVEQTQRFLP